MPWQAVRCQLDQLEQRIEGVQKQLMPLKLGGCEGPAYHGLPADVHTPF